MECLLAYFNMVTVPRKMVRLERMLDYRGFTVNAVYIRVCTVCLSICQSINSVYTCAHVCVLCVLYVSICMHAMYMYVHTYVRT